MIVDTFTLATGGAIFDDGGVRASVVPAFLARVVRTALVDIIGPSKVECILEPVETKRMEDK